MPRSLKLPKLLNSLAKTSAWIISDISSMTMTARMTMKMRMTDAKERPSAYRKVKEMLFGDPDYPVQKYTPQFGG
jgi:hypothetical protein